MPAPFPARLPVSSAADLPCLSDLSFRPVLSCGDPTVPNYCLLPDCYYSLTPPPPPPPQIRPPSAHPSFPNAHVIFRLSRSLARSPVTYRPLPAGRLLDRCILSCPRPTALLPALHHSTLCLHVFTSPRAPSPLSPSLPPPLLPRVGHHT